MRKSDDTISRQDATTLPFLPKEHREYQTNNLDDAFEYGWMELTKCIESLPSADRPTGHIVTMSSGLFNPTMWAACSECDEPIEPFYKFCPHCGARFCSFGERKEQSHE